MIYSLIFQILFLFFLILAHEYGHYLSAKILKLKILSYGFTVKPYPHFYVKVDYISERLKRFLYLIAGQSITIIMFCCYLMLFYNNVSFLYPVFILFMIIETNPIYSDPIFVIIHNIMQKNRIPFSQEVFNSILNNLLFSYKWYIYFIIWILYIYFLFSTKFFLLCYI